MSASQGTRSSPRDVLRRSVVLPVALFYDVQRLAQADHFASTQAWVVVQLQAIATAREDDLRPPDPRRRRAA